MVLRPLTRAAALAAFLLLLLGAPAGAQTPGSQGRAPQSATTQTDPNAPVPVTNLDAPQPGRRLTGRQVVAIAAKVGKVRDARRKYRGSYPGAYTKGPGRWQVSYFSRDKPPKEIAQILIDDRTGAVLEAWTGYQVAWTMARGYPGAFGRKVNSPWVWIPLTILFVVPFLTPRRPFRLLHLDLLVLVAFGISVAFFNDARIDTSVPLVYPLLAYVLLRAAWIGLRTRPERDPAARGEPLPLLVPATWLAIAVVFLMGFRVGLNITDSNVIDVGYAGVIGADKLVHGDPIYGAFPSDNEHGDTYGPVVYEAYVPFEQLLGWSGRWDDLPAAHGAAIVFDVLALLLCFLVGRRMRGPTLGVAMAYAWAAFPFTLYALSTNTNDTLVIVLVLAAIWAAQSAPARGAFAALGGLTKFASLGLAPLFARHRPPGARGAGTAAFAAAFVAVALVVFAPVLLQGAPLHTIYDRTLGFQAERGSPFSIWGLYDLPALQHVWQALAALFALAVAFLPRRRDVVGLAALAAAVLVALQLGVTHWFYLYLVWFFPLVMLALLGRYAEPAPASR